MNMMLTDYIARLAKTTGRLSLGLALALGLTGGVSQAAGPLGLDLGTATNFAVLGASTVTNSGASNIMANLGVAPGTAITGFPPGNLTGTMHAADAVALQAQNDVGTAYNALSGQACNTIVTGQDLGGLTLTEGVYCFASAAQLTGQLTLDAQGNPNATWVFQVGSSLNTATDASVLLINGGNACNVAWQVGSSATLGTGNTFVGNILALVSISLGTGTTVSGRTLAHTGAVTMATNDISLPVCGAPTAVTLADFAAQAQGETVVVRWTTTIETDNLGFNLWRGTAPDAPTEQLNAVLIPTQAAQGGAYEWVDGTAQAGTTYFYWLDAVGTDGGTTRHGPISATPEASSAVTLTTIAATPAPLPTGLRAGLAVLGAALLSTLGWHRWRRAPRDS